MKTNMPSETAQEYWGVFYVFLFFMSHVFFPESEFFFGVMLIVYILDLIRRQENTSISTGGITIIVNDKPDKPKFDAE